MNHEILLRHQITALSLANEAEELDGKETLHRVWKGVEGILGHPENIRPFRKEIWKYLLDTNTIED